MRSALNDMKSLIGVRDKNLLIYPVQSEVEIKSAPYIANYEGAYCEPSLRVRCKILCHEAEDGFLWRYRAKAISFPCASAKMIHRFSITNKTFYFLPQDIIIQSLDLTE